MIRRGLLRFTISTMLAVGATVLTAGAGIAAALYFWTRDDAHRYQLDSLAQTRALVDSFLEAAQKTAFSIAINADASRAILLPWRMERDFELLLRVNKILSERVNSTPFIDSIILYSPENRKVMANFGVSDVELYHDPGLIEEIEKIAVPSLWLRTRSQIRGSVETQNVLSYVVRLPVNQIDVRGYLVLNVNEDALFATIDNADQARLSRLVILDTEGSIISGADKRRIGTSFGDGAVMGGFVGDQGYFLSSEADASTERLFISYVRDPVRNWIYVSEQNSSDLFAKSRLVLSLTAAVSVVCLFFGLGLSFALSRRSWRPVQDELDRSRDMLGQHFIASLLGGKKMSLEDFRRNCRELGLPLERGPYQVLVVNAVDPTVLLGPEAGDESLLAAELYRRCYRALELAQSDAAVRGPGRGGIRRRAKQAGGMQAAGIGAVALVESGEAVVLLRHDSQDAAAAEELLDRWRLRFLALGDGKDKEGFVFYFGGIHDAYTDIPLAYAEARKAVETVDEPSDEPSPKGDRAQETVEKIRAYIDRNYHEQIDLAGMAEKVYVSVPYLCKIFKQSAGTTYFEYLTAVRVEKAKELLRTTRIPIHMVAERTGFLNKRNINRAFHKYLALTPSDYRSRCGAENLSAGTASGAADGDGSGAAAFPAASDAGGANSASCSETEPDMRLRT